MNKGSWGKIRAFFDVETEEGFNMKGLKLVEGVNGLFIGMPSEKGSDGEYRDTIWAEKELKDSLRDLVKDVYESGDGVASQVNFVPKELIDKDADYEQQMDGVGDKDIPF